MFHKPDLCSQDQCLQHIWKFITCSQLYYYFCFKNVLDHWRALCSSVEVQSHVGGIYCLHLQGWRMSQARNQLGLLFNPEMEEMSSPKMWVYFTKLQCYNPEDRGLIIVRASIPWLSLWLLWYIRNMDDIGLVLTAWEKITCYKVRAWSTFWVI